MRAIILQECATADNTHREFGTFPGTFWEMLRLCIPRHSAYARAHRFDYRINMGDIHPEYTWGAWPKVFMLRDALADGYDYAVWLDTDAAIMDMTADLRDALPPDKYIGAVLHDPAKSEYLQSREIGLHYNVGVLYFRNSELTRQFIADWLASFPGDERWKEQGVFNDLVKTEKYAPLFAQVDDRYNATINVNNIPNPAVFGWHGVMPPVKRLDMMRSAFRDDFHKFRV